MIELLKSDVCVRYPTYLYAYKKLTQYIKLILVLGNLPMSRLYWILEKIV